MFLLKNDLLNWYSSMKIFIEKIRLIFIITNWLWKYDFGTFWKNPKGQSISEAVFHCSNSSKKWTKFLQKFALATRADVFCSFFGRIGSKKFASEIIWPLIHQRIFLEKIPLSMLILGQKSCFLGPTILRIPQLNWH